MDQQQNSPILTDELSTVWKRAQHARARYIKVRIRRLLARAFRGLPAGAPDVSAGSMTSGMRLAAKELP
jgi:hypothetical protein